MKDIKFLEKSIKKFKDGGGLHPNKSMGNLFLKFLWVRDQAHIFHWQTPSNAEHTTLGVFYEEYLEELDALAEIIFGKNKKPCSIEGNNSIEFVNYSEQNLEDFCMKVRYIFTEEFQKYFPDTNENAGIYHKLGDIVELINKTEYLLSQK